MSTFSFVRFSLISIFAWLQFVMENPIRDVYKPLYRCLSSYVLNFRTPVRWVPLPLGGKVCIQSLLFDFLISDCLIQKVVLALLFSLDGSTEEFLDHNVPTVLSALARRGTGIYPRHAFPHFNPLSWNFQANIPSILTCSIETSNLSSSRNSKWLSKTSHPSTTPPDHASVTLITLADAAPV